MGEWTSSMVICFVVGDGIVPRSNSRDDTQRRSIMNCCPATMATEALPIGGVVCIILIPGDIQTIVQSQNDLSFKLHPGMD